MHIACCEYPVHVSFILPGLRVHVRSGIDLHAEGFRHVVLASQEACRDQHHVNVHRKLASFDGHHHHAAGFLILFALQPAADNLFQVSGLVADEFFHRRGINTRIFAEQGNGFLLAVIGLADSRPFGPGIVLRSRIRGFRHHLQLHYRFRAQADGSSHTVVACVAAADDHNILPFRGNEFLIRKIGIQQAFGGGPQKIHREIDAVQLPARGLDVSRIGGAAGQNHPVILFQEISGFLILSDIGVYNEFHAFRFHHLDLPVDDMLLQFHVRNAVAQKPAYPVKTFEYRNRMAPVIQLIGGGKARGAAADDGDLLAGPVLRRFRHRVAFLISIFNDGQLVASCAHRLPVQIAGTGLLAESRADPSGEFRKAAGPLETLVGLLPVSHIQQIVPLRNQVP